MVFRWDSLQKILGSLGNFVGHFLEYNSTNRAAVWREYMRIRVNVDVTQPLKCFKKIKHGGGTVTVIFKYEKLQKFYFVCGRLDHTKHFCDMLSELSKEQVEAVW